MGDCKLSNPVMPDGISLSAHFALTMGSWITGAAFTIFAQGIIMMQSAKYIRLCRFDSGSTKVMVAFVAITTLAKCGLNFWNLWFMTVTNYGDFDGAARITWSTSFTHVSGQLITFICQLFYIKRVWRVTRNRLWTGITAFACGGSLILSIGVTIPFLVVTIKNDGHLTQGNPRLISLITPLFSGWVALLIVADCLITGIMMRFLLSSRTNTVSSVDKESYSLLLRLMRVTLESAFPPLIIAILGLIVYSTLASIGIGIACSLTMPSLYAICLMHTVNQRCQNRILQQRAGSLEQAGHSAQ